jgi:drug/metabolite transporter (DMT)-like permease
VLESTIILTLEPILNPVWVFLVIGEAPGQLALLGSMLVVGAVIARAIVSARATAEDVSQPGQAQVAGRSK